MFSRRVCPAAGAEDRQSAARRYLKRVKRRLICPYRQKKAFLSRVEDALFLFSTDSEDAGWNALVAQFGAPENAADEFMSELEPCRQQRFLRRRYWTVTAVCTVLVLSAVLSVLYALNCQRHLNDGYYVEFITREIDTLPEITAPTYFHIVFSSEDNSGEVPDEE